MPQTGGAGHSNPLKFSSGHSPYSDGYLNGLKLTYLTAATVQIESGTCRDSTNAFNIENSGTISLDITVSGAGGLDTGSEAANTWYAVHIITDTTGVNAVDAIFSLSGTAPTLPSGYDVFRRVGWVRNDGSSNFLKFYQDGIGIERTIFYDETLGTVRPLNGGTATTYTDVDCSDEVPSTSQKFLALVQFRTGTSGAISDRIRIRRNGAAVGNSTLTQFRAGVVSNTRFFMQGTIYTDASQIIEYRVDDGAENDVSISVIGYYDNL